MEKKMLKKNIAAAVMALSLITGCASLTGEQSANLDRGAEVNRIITEIEELGYDDVAVLPAVDEVLNGLSAYVKKQKTVAEEYRDIVKDFRDVSSFLAANKGKTELELLAEADKFDKGAKSTNEKIAPKLKAYRKATKKIADENSELTVALAEQGIKLTYYVSQYGDEIAKLGGIKLLGGMFSGNDNEVDTKPTIPSAILRGKDQLFLVEELNSLIEADQEVAENLSKLQEQMNARG